MMANLEDRSDLGLGIFLAGMTACTTADGACCAGVRCGGTSGVHDAEADDGACLAGLGGVASVWI